MPLGQYSGRFQIESAAKHYDDFVYAQQSHDSYLGLIEAEILVRVVRQLTGRGGVRYMDFACGTGRILSMLAPHTEVAVGIDVSPVMVERASTRVAGATTRVQDVRVNPTVAEGPFDLITAFRFFLNVDPALREPYLSALARNLRSRESLLLFNVHGNRHSVRHVAAAYRKSGPEQFNEMSRSECLELLNRAGLEVVEWWGVGVLPRTLYKPGIAPAVAELDRVMFASGLFRKVSQNLIFACRRAA